MFYVKTARYFSVHHLFVLTRTVLQARGVLHFRWPTAQWRRVASCVSSTSSHTLFARASPSLRFRLFCLVLSFALN